MSCSKLVSYTRLSPNNSGRRKYPITRITPHYVCGYCTVETLGEIFAPTSRQASSNYGIGYDGRVAMYVDEDDRAWTSGSYDNDNRAITIEVANLSDGSLTNASWNSLVKLCADICSRYGIRPTYTGDTGGTFTKHHWFQQTDCPGPWLDQQFTRLSQEVAAMMATGYSPGGSAKPRNNTNGGKLDVDGVLGGNTVLDWQHAMGTWEDGVVSGQVRSWQQAHFPSLVSVEFNTGTGSSLIKAVQRGLGGLAVDGLIGPNTAKAIQRRLVDKGYSVGRYGVDGMIGSSTAMALQKCLNDGKW